MKRVLIRFVALAAMFAPLGAAAQTKIDAGIRATPDCAIRLMGPLANIRVIGWQRDSIAVTGTLPKTLRLEQLFGEDPAQPVRGVKLTVERLVERTPPAGTIELRVPVGARVAIISGSAEIDVTGIAGEVDITMLGGAARVNGSPRLLTVDAINASVTVDGNPDRVRLKTAEGNITMRGGSRDAGFSTVSGRVYVSSGALERAHFDATTGDIILATDLAPAGLITIESHGGLVDLLFDNRASARIEASTGAGVIENLATKMRPSPGREGRGQELVTEIGTGSARVVVRTYKGTVRLARR